MMDFKSRPDTWAQVSEIFNTCTSITSSDDLTYLYMHLSNGYQYMAMTDYPYPANFLEPMPAWPVEVSTQPFADIPLVSDWMLTHPQFVPTVKPVPEKQFNPFQTKGPKDNPNPMPVDSSNETEAKKSWFRKVYDYLLNFFYNAVDRFERMFGFKAMHTPYFQAFLHEVMSEPRSNSDGLSEREILL